MLNIGYVDAGLTERGIMKKIKYNFGLRYFRYLITKTKILFYLYILELLNVDRLRNFAFSIL